MKRFTFIASMGFVLMILGCDSAYFSKTYSFESDQWTYDDPRRFEFEIRDVDQVYNMVLSIGHTDKFPYQNLYLQTKTYFPTDTITTQRLSLEVADDAGYWYGECSGSKCQIDIPIQSQVHFTDPGSYALELEQYTRMDTLPGIRSIALRLIKVE